MIFKKTGYCVNVVFNDCRVPGSCKFRVAATLESLKAGIKKMRHLHAEFRGVLTV
jgi:hypothetical protein